MEQAVVEAAGIDLTVATMPLALALPLAILELPGVTAAVGVIDTALALQQPVDHFPTITAAIGQPRIGWRQRLAITAGGDQQ